MLGLTLDTGAEPLRLLCLGAHPDDLEIGCGGTVLRLLAEHPGASVHWVVFAGSAAREAEARASARALLSAAGEVTVAVHAFRDGYLPDAWGQVKDEFEKLKLDIAPHAVLTHWRHDAHQDHRVVAELTWNTFRDQLILEYEIPKYDGDLGAPNFYVPLTAADCERKIAVLMEHFPSQRGRPWFEPESFRALARVRGIECHAPERYAEAFYCRKAVLAVPGAAGGSS
jgi:LmbE family N-acetylglucosaminyl deacetylase